MRGVSHLGVEKAGLLKPSTIQLSKKLSLYKEAYIKKIGVLQKEDRDRVTEYMDLILHRW